MSTNIELEYIDRANYKKELQFALEFIIVLQKKLKINKEEKITFQPLFIGSKKTNLILQPKNNQKFDFDINLQLGNKTKIKNTEDIINKVFETIPTSIKNYPYKIKKSKTKGQIIQLEIQKNNELFFSIDLAITKTNNENDIFILGENGWEERNHKLEKIKSKVKQIKNESKWNYLRNNYKELKTAKYNKTAPSRSSYVLYIEAVHNTLENSY